MKLVDYLAEEFAETESRRLAKFQLEDISLRTGILNGYREAFKKAAELAERPDLLKRRAPYEYDPERPVGRPVKHRRC